MVDRVVFACLPVPRRSDVAFSMVEVLVTISLLVFLLALLMPGLGAARERARRVVCANNLRQWGAAAQYYRDENDDYLPTEGTFLRGGIAKPGTWFNELPPLLGLPPYRDFEGAGEAIADLPNIHTWICPSKNRTGAYKSGSGKNQFHYGMNQVLDGLGSLPDGSRDTPGFPDQGEAPVHARMFDKRPNTVFMFDIYSNSMAGTPRSVASVFQRTYQGGYIGEFHGDYANVLFLGGAVGNCVTDDLVTDRDFRRGDVIWTRPELYWGYRPPAE